MEGRFYQCKPPADDCEDLTGDRLLYLYPVSYLLPEKHLLLIFVGDSLLG